MMLKFKVILILVPFIILISAGAFILVWNKHGKEPRWLTWGEFLPEYQEQKERFLKTLKEETNGRQVKIYELREGTDVTWFIEEENSLRVYKANEGKMRKPTEEEFNKYFRIKKDGSSYVVKADGSLSQEISPKEERLSREFEKSLRGWEEHLPKYRKQKERFFKMLREGANGKQVKIYELREGTDVTLFVEGENFLQVYRMDEGRMRKPTEIELKKFNELFVKKGIKPDYVIKLETAGEEKGGIRNSLLRQSERQPWGKHLEDTRISADNVDNSMEDQEKLDILEEERTSDLQRFFQREIHEIKEDGTQFQPPTPRRERGFQEDELLKWLEWYLNDGKMVENLRNYEGLRKGIPFPSYRRGDIEKWKKPITPGDFFPRFWIEEQEDQSRKRNLSFPVRGKK